MSLAGCQIDLNFHLQKCLEILDKNLSDKIQSKNYKGVNPRQSGLNNNFKISYSFQTTEAILIG